MGNSGTSRRRFLEDLMGITATTLVTVKALNAWESACEYFGNFSGNNSEPTLKSSIVPSDENSEPTLEEKLKYIIDFHLKKENIGDYTTSLGTKKARELGILLPEGYYIFQLVDEKFLAILSYKKDENSYVDIGIDGKLDHVFKNPSAIGEESRMDYIGSIHQAATDSTFKSAKLGQQKIIPELQGSYEKLISDAYKVLKSRPPKE